MTDIENPLQKIDFSRKTLVTLKKIMAPVILAALIIYLMSILVPDKTHPALQLIIYLLNLVTIVCIAPPILNDLKFRDTALYRNRNDSAINKGKIRSSFYRRLFALIPWYYHVINTLFALNAIVCLAVRNNIYLIIDDKPMFPQWFIDVTQGSLVPVVSANGLFWAFAAFCVLTSGIARKDKFGNDEKPGDIKESLI